MPTNHREFSIRIQKPTKIDDPQKKGEHAYINQPGSISPEQWNLLFGKFGTTEVGIAIFNQLVSELGVLPPYAVLESHLELAVPKLTILGKDLFIPKPVSAETMFLFDPDLKYFVARVAKLVRPGFQKAIQFGDMSTQPHTDKTQHHLRTAALEYLSHEGVSRNAEPVSRQMKKHMADWTAQLQSNEGLPVRQANYNLFIDIVGEVMFGTTIDQQLKDDLSWMFSEGINFAVASDGLLHIAKRLTSGDTKAQIDRALGVNKKLQNIVDNNFMNYIVSGNETGLIDNHIEVYLQRAFGEDVTTTDENGKEKTTLDLTELNRKKAEWKQILSSKNEQAIAKLMKSKEIRRVLTQARDQSKGSGSAGFETTANSSSFVLIEAANHPDLFKKVLDEVASIDDISTLSLSDVIRLLPQTYAFCRETLLHHAPVSQFREVAEDAEIYFAYVDIGGMVEIKQTDENGNLLQKINGHHSVSETHKISLKKGAVVDSILAVAHRFSGNFDPDKHVQALQNLMSSHAHVSDARVTLHATEQAAFAPKDPHNCIGKYLAVMEMIFETFYLAKDMQNNNCEKLEAYCLDGSDPTEAIHAATSNPKWDVRIRFAN